VIEDSEMVDDRFIAVWGPGAEFGALRISATEVYWYGYFQCPANSVFDDELGAAREMFAHWPALVTDTVAATTSRQLMRHDVYHLPKGLSTYVCGRVVMAGDAAHAFLPTMGQGVATSLEDGACVGRLIAQPVNQGAALAPALAAYDRARPPRCRKIARQAVTIGRLGAHLGVAGDNPCATPSCDSRPPDCSPTAISPRNSWAGLLHPDQVRPHTHLPRDRTRKRTTPSRLGGRYRGSCNGPSTPIWLPGPGVFSSRGG
jgi:hypothetical protein